MNLPRVSDIVGIINKIAPPRYAEEWDNVGLQIGDATVTVQRIMVALDPGKNAVEAAVTAGCNLLVTHHPLIFSPLKKIVTSDPTGSVIALAMKHGLAVAALHTNYDIAAGGVNDLLAEKLSLSTTVPLKITGRDELVKMAVFVPLGHESQLLAALSPFMAAMGNYRECSFRTGGVGTFRPVTGATPHLGSVGVLSEVEEVRLELLLKSESVAGAVTALKKAHPYEEPAYDLYPVLNSGDSRGLGRMGELEAVTTLREFAAGVKEKLGATAVRYVGAPECRIKRVAICGGSGISLMREAVRQGADVLVTGDVKYHEARAAEDLGIALVDAGHFATERPMIQGLTVRLGQELAARGYGAEIVAFQEEMEPFRHV